MKNNNLSRRMSFAVSGLRYAFYSEKSLRFQSAMAIIVLLVLVILRPEPIWWAVILIVIIMVLSAEMFNTAIELLCDYVQPDKHEVIGKIKDIAAGGVLLTSIGSVFVALFLLIDMFRS